MTLDEAIQHAEKVAERLENSHKRDWMCEDDERCAKEHRQLAEWLKELKQLKEQELCEDCISRNATVERLCKVAEFMDEKRDGLGSPYVMAALFIQDNKDKFPSVTPKQRWIPVSERLPDNTDPVNITWVNHNPESYYADIKDKPFTATGHYCNGRWWWYSVTCQDYLDEYGHWDIDAMDDEIEVIAWMPLPGPYKAKGSDKV